jgi:hypothetical protein
MHLRALTLGTASPTAAADLYAALGVRIGGTPRGDTLALVGRTMITYRRTPAPTRTVLGFLAPDLAVVVQRLSDAGIDCSRTSPGVIEFRDIDANPCYAVESPHRTGLSLIAATLFVRDVAATTAWWAAAGMPTGRSETLGYRVPRTAQHGADGAAAFLDRDLTLHLVDAGDGPVTTAMQLRVHVAAPAALDAAEAGLTALAATVERRGPTELWAMTPEGIELALEMREGVGHGNSTTTVCSGVHPVQPPRWGRYQRGRYLQAIRKISCECVAYSRPGVGPDPRPGRHWWGDSPATESRRRHRAHR